MKIYDQNKNLLFETKFPTRKFNRLLKSEGISHRPIEKLESKDYQEVFLTAIKWFLENNLTEDELSDIADELFFGFIKLKFSARDGDLESALISAAEIAYYSRFGTKSQTNSFRKDVTNYYNKYSKDRTIPTSTSESQ